MPVNHHTGSASPDYGDYPEAKVMFLVEATWWAHRALWHLIFAGRHGAPPDAAVRVHRAGHGLAPRAAATLDYYKARMSDAAGLAGAGVRAEVMSSCR